MIVAMTKASSLVQSYDLSSVSVAAVGASGISKEIILAFGNLLPQCKVLQGYGMTETTGAVCFGNLEDQMTGSCGHLFPGYEMRLIGEDGQDVEAYSTPGELVLRSPSVVLGYFQNEEANAEAMLEGQWLRTGDLMEIRQSPAGHEHLFIVDRVKELIKVRVRVPIYAYSRKLLTANDNIGSASCPCRIGITSSSSFCCGRSLCNSFTR